MDQTYIYKTKDVCSREMRIVYDGDLIKRVTIVGGCAGNTQAVSKLVVGRHFQEVIDLIKGIRCPGSRTQATSCPDQLALALEEIQKLG